MRKNHGMSNTPTYTTWVCIVQRCTNPNNTRYHDYGGRGIVMCKRWRSSFLAFYKDMGKRPQGKQINRIDNGLGYYKDNCCWSTPAENMQNTKNTVLNRELVRKIRTLYQNGNKPRLISNKLKLNYNLIRNIVYHDVWKNVQVI